MCMESKVKKRSVGHMRLTVPNVKPLPSPDDIPLSGYSRARWKPRPPTFNLLWTLLDYHRRAYTKNTSAMLYELIAVVCRDPLTTEVPYLHHLQVRPGRGVNEIKECALPPTTPHLFHSH